MGIGDTEGVRELGFLDAATSSREKMLSLPLFFDAATAGATRLPLALLSLLGDLPLSMAVKGGGDGSFGVLDTVYTCVFTGLNESSPSCSSPSSSKLSTFTVPFEPGLSVPSFRVEEAPDGGDSLSNTSDDDSSATLISPAAACVLLTLAVSSSYRKLPDVSMSCILRPAAVIALPKKLVRAPPFAWPFV